MIVGLIYARPWSALLKQWLVDVSTTARDSLEYMDRDGS